MKKSFISHLILGGLAMMLLLSAPLTIHAQEDALWMRYPAISPDGKTVAFSYQGDLFTVPVTGGTAQPLTRHTAYDYRPVWSPDGKHIAFSSDRFGQFDIFLIPTAGGKAQRLTFHSSGDFPTAFTSNGQAVLFRSSRLDTAASSAFPTGGLPELYKVSVKGGQPHQVLTTPAMDAQISRDGRYIIYHDQKGYENAWRKHHTSAVTRDIRIYDKKTGKHTILTDFAGEDRNPVWSPDETSIYYLSEAKGSFNVWKMDRNDPKNKNQVTFHKHHPVRFLSITAAGDLCYGYHGEIYVLKKGGSKPVKVPVRTSLDAAVNDREFVTISSGATEMALSPNEKEIAFIARGEVFVTSVEHRTTKRITDTPGQERSISFSPDGRKLLFAGELDKSWNLYEASLTRKDEKYFHNATLVKVKPLLATDKETFQPAYSPDGKEVAFLEERTTLKILTPATGNTRVALAGDKNYSYMDGDQWFQWSPDGKWLLATFLDHSRWSDEVGLVDASGKKEVVNLTNSGYFDGGPRWGMKGKMVYWASNRHGMRSHASWGSQADVYGMFFTAEAFDRFNLSKEELALLKEKEKEDKKADKKEDKKKDKKGKDKKTDKKDAVEPIKIDLKNLEERKVRLTIHSSNLWDMALSPDGEKLVYLCRFEKGYDLWINELREKKTRLLAKLGSRGGDLTFDKKGENVFLISRGNIKKINVNSGKQKPVSYHAEMRLRTDKERAYMFEHMWRQMLKKFYVKDMHGVDWAFYKKEYRRFLPHIVTNWDFAEMMSEMLGELNASHTGSGYRPNYKNPDSTTFLGVFFDQTHKGDGLKIKEIIEKGPLDKASSSVRVGTVIKKINGTAVTAGMNYYPLLNRQAGKNMLLTLYNPATRKEWEETIKPLPGRRVRGLLYQRWVKARRLETDRLSNGRLGYVHVQGMNDASFRVVYSEALGRWAGKEGLIVDTRFNGGGNLHDGLATFLNGKQYLRYVPRGQQLGVQPIRRWTKPSIVLMGEGSYSDAHMFPYAYRALGIGKLVGMPVPGTGTSVWWETQQDRSLFFGIPEVGYVGNDGKYLENQQVEPDYKVENDPESTAQGRDKQLEKAVKVLLSNSAK